ncbi:MAG: SPFH domain-containing protein [Terracidiphilus sp.]|jgi:hypothetical protein
MISFVRQRVAIQRICWILILSSMPMWPQQAKTPASKKGPVDAKCAFLRSEVRRLAQDEQDFITGSPLAIVTSPDSLVAANSTVSDWADYIAATEVFTARRTIIGLEVSSCERKIRLSDPSRLASIEYARIAQVRRAADRWQGLAADQGKDLSDGIIGKINAIYEAETRSFYNPAISRFDDPDIGKDYPNLNAMIQGSSLDQGTKDFYSSALPLLRYEEAGRLANALSGVDKDQGLNYAYLLRKTLGDRVAIDSANLNQITNEVNKERSRRLMYYAICVLAALFLLALAWVATDRTRAKFRAFRLGLKRSPFWGGNAEWIFWDPGETVVLLEQKKLVPMKDRDGGYRTISAWKGQEYKGRISYKTQFSTWRSDPIITSDGLAVSLGVGIWWRIVDAGLYVSRIAADYHEGDHHTGENLAEAAEFWIKKLAAGTLREEVNQLPAEKLISPYVEAYLQVNSGSNDGLPFEQKRVPNFSDQLGKAQDELKKKTIEYGIEIERLEVQELILPPVYQQKLEAVRIAFLEPTQAAALTKAQVIALEGLAGVIGKEKVGLIEVLKHVDLSRLNMNPFTGVVPIVQPMIDTLSRQSEKALPPSTAQDGENAGSN